MKTILCINKFEEEGFFTLWYCSLYSGLVSHLYRGKHYFYLFLADQKPLFCMVHCPTLQYCIQHIYLPMILLPLFCMVHCPTLQYCMTYLLDIITIILHGPLPYSAILHDIFTWYYYRYFVWSIALLCAQILHDIFTWYYYHYFVWSIALLCNIAWHIYLNDIITIILHGPLPYSAILHDIFTWYYYHYFAWSIALLCNIAWHIYLILLPLFCMVHCPTLQILHDIFTWYYYHYFAWSIALLCKYCMTYLLDIITIILHGPLPYSANIAWHIYLILLPLFCMVHCPTLQYCMTYLLDIITIILHGPLPYSAILHDIHVFTWYYYHYFVWSIALLCNIAWHIYLILLCFSSYSTATPFVTLMTFLALVWLINLTQVLILFFLFDFVDNRTEIIAGVSCGLGFLALLLVVNLIR